MKIRFIFLSLLITACGGGGGSSDNSTSTAKIAPRITNLSKNYEVYENQNAAFTVTATDPDSTSLTYSISGTDASQFSIGSATGQVMFSNNPDFENPNDDNEDNQYQFSVAVSDGSLNDTEDFTVSVLDDYSDNPDSDPECSVYIIEGDIAIPNTEQCTMFRGGLLREFIIYVPQSYASQTSPVPLLFSLHGYTSRAEWNYDYTGFQDVADNNGFIAVYPQGSIFSSTGETHWNVGGWTTGSTTDDIDFLNSLIDYLPLNYSIDLNRVYSTGMSNGGFMSYHLACNLSTKIAAIASVTGSMTNKTYNDCDPKHPTPVLQIHGKLDGTVPYAGNSGMKPIEEVMDYWVNYNGCNLTPTQTQIEDANGDGYGGTLTQYINCLNTVGVELYLLDAVGHQWPAIDDDDDYDIHSADVIWGFLSKYNIDGLIQ